MVEISMSGSGAGPGASQRPGLPDGFGPQASGTAGICDLEPGAASPEVWGSGA